MKNGNFLLCLLLVVLVMSIIINLSLIENKKVAARPQIANPASVYCVKQGGSLEIRKDQAGNESGYCLFTNGQECEEWSFFRGICAKN